MGLNMGFSSSGLCDCGPRPPMPDPKCYAVLRSQYSQHYLVLEVQYPDCTNYEGRKILVFDCKVLDLVRQGAIDPHFSETGFSPIARFEPTPRGWELALSLGK
jgi:hypothetical protein